jgi:DNA helicase-2/ATP-dependent DNA helicase PcrA
MQMRGAGRTSTLQPIAHKGASKKIISAALDVHRTSLSKLGFEAKEGHIQSLISRAKSRGNKALLSDPYLNHSGRNRPQASPQVQQILQGIYDSYETALRTLNGLDFDDLLVFGVKLLKDNQILELEHLFIDELSETLFQRCMCDSANQFSSQDTSILQLEIMNHMAPHGCLTIVGDPDQSSKAHLPTTT